MTVIGKVLTFLVFFLSLVFVGFGIQIHRINMDPQTKKSWREVAFIERDERNKLVQELDYYKTRVAEAEAREQAKAKEDATKVTVAQNEASAAKARSQTLELANKKLTTEFDDARRELVATIAELESRRKEVSEYQVQLRDAQKQQGEILAKLNKEENLKIKFQVEAGTLNDRVAQLEGQLKRVTREYEEIKEAKSVQLAKAGATQPFNPPPDSVEGKILEVTPDGLVEISLGSDDGLQVGHDLEVFREKPAPKYLGTVRITDVREKRAVGKLKYPEYFKLVKAEDIVASKIIK